MFVEHRNEILEDMVVCECKSADLARTVVHQEVYDGGSAVLYRVTLLHRDGTRQSAVLQLDTEKIEEGRDDRNGARLRIAEEPSLRFPIEPCRVYHNLSPVNRVFVYSSSSYEPPDKSGRPASPMRNKDKSGRPASPMRNKEGATPGSFPAAGQVFDAARPQWQTSPSAPCVPAFDNAEDWHSAGGGFSDGEVDMVPEGRAGPAKIMHVGAQAGIAGRAEDQHSAYASAVSPMAGSPGSSPADLDTPAAMQPAGGQEGGSFAVQRPLSAWLRPLVESSVLLAGVEEPPFRCFPQSIS